MNALRYEKIAFELNIAPAQVQATAELLQAEATVPFIARYRKEATGSLDEVAITSIRDRLQQLEELEKKPFLTPQDETEIKILKKKKLAHKDKMEEILIKYR